MPRDGALTRQRILDATQDLVLKKGYAATSIEDILAATGLTKGAFFYHFKSKAELAQALIARFSAAEERLLTDMLGRVERLSRDPLHQVLTMAGLFEEMFDELGEATPGCLFASYCYEQDLFGDDVRQICSGTMYRWRGVLAAKLTEAAARHPPRLELDASGLADMLTALLEGAYVMARTLKDTKIIPAQLRQFRNYLELLFAP